MNDQAVSRFWDNFISKLTSYGVKPGVLRWHVLHVEQYIKAHSHIKLAQHNALTVEIYLKNKGRNTTLRDWQFSQMVTALEILFVEIVNSSWAKDFPWQHWKNSARELP